MWTNSFDRCFLINIESNTERLSNSLTEMIKYGVKVDIFKAIHDLGNGANGLLKTMHNLFEESKGNSVIVFEDDVLILREDFNEIMECVMRQLPTDFDLLYLGCNLLLPPVKVSDNLLKVSAAYSSHCVLYSKKAIDLILSLWNNKEEKPYDMFLMQKIQPYGKSFCTNPMLVSQRKGVSNIFEYVPEKQIGIETYYDVKTKEIDWGLFMKNQFELLTKNI